jgi:predicted TPR repeat methyltransferase
MICGNECVYSSRMILIQSQMTERAIQLLGIQSDSGPLRFLDIGCGSGLSGNTYTTTTDSYDACIDFG